MDSHRTILRKGRRNQILHVRSKAFALEAGQKEQSNTRRRRTSLLRKYGLYNQDSRLNAPPTDHSPITNAQATHAPKREQRSGAEGSPHPCTGKQHHSNPIIAHNNIAEEIDQQKCTNQTSYNSHTASGALENITNDRKRRRGEDALQLPSGLPKRQFPKSSVSAEHISERRFSPIENWILEGSWTGKNFEKDDNTMLPLIARKKKKSTLSLRRKHSESGLGTPSDQQSSLRASESDQPSSEEKAPKYENPRYRTVLQIKGSFMRESEEGVTETSKTLIQELLHTDQPIHDESLFRDDLFSKTCQKIESENESRVIIDVMRLIVPSAEVLATYGATDLELLIEGVNKAWINSIPFCGPQPQPDYSVGFRRSAFTKEQLKRLQPFIGGWDFTSLFMATDTIHFPFLTCEVKCGDGGLDVADRQNAHSMTVAVRGIVDLFRAVHCEQELNGEILAFSISHDYTMVRIYGHYAFSDGKETSYYRRPIRSFSFTELDGREKWAAYKFTRNVYHKFVPIHLKRIHSAIDQIPSELNFDVSEFSHQSPLRTNDDSQPISDDVTPNTSFSQAPGQAPKRPRRQQ